MFVQPLLHWKSSEFYTTWECVFVALVVQHEMCMRHIVIYGLPYCTAFFHIISNNTIFKKELLNTKCIFWFSVQPLSETFLILRRNEWDTIKNV